MADDRLRLRAEFDDKASAGVRRLGKTLGDVKPSNGMAAATKWMADFRGAADKANVAVRPITSSLSALGVGGLAASLSMAELVRQVKELAGGALDLRDLSRQSLISVGDLQKLQFVAAKVRIDPAALSGALVGFSDKMLDLKRHTGEFYTYLLRQNEGVAQKIAADSPVDALKDTLDYLSRIKDPAIQRRVADTMNLGAFVPMLGKGPDGLAAMFAEAGREVKPITQAMIEASERLNESTTNLNQSWANLKNDIGPSIINPLSNVIDRLDGTLKLAAAHPGETGAIAGIGAGSAAALYARYRIMRGSSLAGGAGLGRAAGELTGAAGALKQAAAALEGSRAAPGTAAEDAQKSGGSFDKGRALLAAAGLAGVVANAPGMDAAGDKERDANASALESFGNLLKRWTGTDWLESKLRQGSKEGIVAGLRELSQQDELKGGGGAGVGDTDGGAHNMRYGKAGGRWRTTPGRHSAGGAGGDHGASGPSGIDYNAKSATDQMGISPKEWDAFREGVTDIEGKRYDRMGGAGKRYAGRYQMGPAEIDATARRLGVARPSNAQFLADPAMQERFFENYTMDHRRTLMRNPKFAAMSAHEQLKILGYAHNQGTGGPTRENGAWGYLDRGAVGHDAFGTSGTAYFKTIQRRLDGAGANPPGAGTPAPSAAAVGDAAVLAARQRILNGSRNPADRDLVDRYKAQQNAPQGHAAGGWIKGPGGPTSDRIPAMLSNGEFVVQAKAAGRFLPLLHAINEGRLSHFAQGGQARRGSGFTPEGRARIASWMDFFMRPDGEGGMGASRRTALGSIAMLQGESGRNLDPTISGWDVNGPSGGSAQWHDVTKGRMAGKLRRFSDLMDFATAQHADWKDIGVQQAFWKKEARNTMRFAWDPMRRARTAPGTLKQGIDKFENPAHHTLEFARRLPNITAMVREGVAGLTRGNAGPIDPVQIDIRHHHNGQTRVSARGGRGTKLGIRSGPTMQPS